MDNITIEQREMWHKYSKANDPELTQDKVLESIMDLTTIKSEFTRDGDKLNIIISSNDYMIETALLIKDIGNPLEVTIGTMLSALYTKILENRIKSSPDLLPAFPQLNK